MKNLPHVSRCHNYDSEHVQRKFKKSEGIFPEIKRSRPGVKSKEVSFVPDR